MTSAGSVTITAEGATADTDWPSTSANESCARCNPDTGELLRIARLLRTVRKVAHHPRRQQGSRVNSEKSQMRIAGPIPVGRRRSGPTRSPQLAIPVSANENLPAQFK